jgi:uncharacterized membrane protein
VQRPELEKSFPDVRIVAPGAPWRWLARGLADLKAAPAASLFYGLVFAGMGAAIDWFLTAAAIELALVTGFLLVAPFLSVGLYDISRRRERGEQPLLLPTLVAWKTNAPAIGFYALILALLLAVWIRVSVVVVALFFTSGEPMEQGLFAELAGSSEGWVFMGAYAAAGSGFALLVFATGVVSIPMLLDRPGMDTITAMITSFRALRVNFAIMLLWAATIVVLVAAGFFAAYVGLVFVVPLIGHATWHAYREAVA